MIIKSKSYLFINIKKLIKKRMINKMEMAHEFIMMVFSFLIDFIKMIKLH